MKLHAILTQMLLVCTTKVVAVTSPITEMGLRQFMEDQQREATREKLFRGHHRKSNFGFGSSKVSLTLVELLRQLEKTQKSVAAKRKMFKSMLKITNGYKRMYN